MKSPALNIDRSCGPSGCQLDWLTSRRHDIDPDPAAFTAYADDNGWGDGLPLIPPTEARVREFLAAGGRFPDEVVAELPPAGTPCTVEKVAINAVMAGAPPESLRLLCAALEAMAVPEFDLAGLLATTGSVVPMVVVNGEIRDRLQIPYQAGCFGGVASPAPAIGRALRLVVRNVAGSVIGITSKSVFGQPGRVAGIVVGEWEEQSPWAPLAERRGVSGDAVTVYATMGTDNICDIVADNGPLLLESIGKSLVFPGVNGFLTSTAFSELMVAVNPTWAAMIAKDIPDIEDVQEQLWNAAQLPLDWWPTEYHAPLEREGRVRDDGRVPIVPSPSDMIVFVCGGLGGLHATALHSWGASLTTTRAVPSTSVD